MHLVRAGEHRVLLDCGLFQGLKALRLRNWGVRLPDAAHVDAVVLSHAHIDHSGYLPLLARQGFRGPIYCTSGTADLLGVVLPDSAHLQEEQAERANRKGYSKHTPALPLYTLEDAQAALRLVEPCGYGRPFAVTPSVTALLRQAGHIVGSATVELQLHGRRLVYSGDLGRYDRPILPDPEPVPVADVLLLESTYGDRPHPAGAEDALVQIVRDAAARGGTILVPAFAVDRTQELLWMLHRLEGEGRVPVLPVYIDSLMAIEVTDIYRRHPEDYDAQMARALASGDRPLAPRNLHIARSEQESRAINGVRGPAIVISSSGMATGGRILHHLTQRLPDPRTTVLLVGFQAAGTRGRALEEGARQLKMFGQMIPVRARIERIDALSAHADAAETLRWLGGFERGLDVPTSGTVHFFEHDLTAANDRELTRFRHEHVGFVFQFYNLIPSLTARENVVLVTEIGERPLDPAEALRLVGLGERLDHFPAQLSGGEQQRVAIARAVAKRPDALLCDQPTGALDYETGKLVSDVLERVNRELGTTTALITRNARRATPGELSW
jgi:metallo-beta-lactamase family protein